MSSDLINKQALCDDLREYKVHSVPVSSDESEIKGYNDGIDLAISVIAEFPSAEPEIIRCKDCKHWKQQINYQGTPLSFGFCESEDMWRSLYGETTEVAHIDTDDNHYCGFAERRTDE